MTEDRQVQANCRLSPSGKHHWWIYGETTKLQSYCKFCGRGGPRFKGVFDGNMFDYAEQRAGSTRALAKKAALHTAYDEHGRL